MLPRAPTRITTSFAFSYVERAILEGLAQRRFGIAEMKAVVEFFTTESPACVYCGDPQISRWDHLVAVKRGGQTVLGNMVPACARCDDAKRDLPFDEWMISDAKNSPKSRGTRDITERIARLNAYALHFGYSPAHAEASLPLHQRQCLNELRQKINNLRSQIEEFLADVSRVDAGETMSAPKSSTHFN